MSTPTPNALEVNVSIESGSARIALAGELDIATAPDFASRVRELPGRDGSRIVLDLRELEFMDSTGLRALLAVADSASALGMDVAIVRGGETVGRILELTGVDQRIAVVDDPSEI
jgi:anti-anti-sigma factor